MGIRRPSGKRQISEYIAVFLVAIVVALTFKNYVAAAYVIPSESMTSTLKVHDHVLVNKLSYDYGKIERGDIVVFKRPPDSDIDPSIDNLIKRVVGLPGDKLQAKNGVLYRNDVIVSEPYLDPGEETDFLDDPIVVPAGKLFVMGDNRENSEDSRFIGPIDEKLVVGRSEAIVWPVKRLHLF